MKSIPKAFGAVSAEILGFFTTGDSVIINDSLIFSLAKHNGRGTPVMRDVRRFMIATVTE